MNKHFSAILEIMDNSKGDLREITLTYKKEIVIVPFVCFYVGFIKEIEAYCKLHNLENLYLTTPSPIIIIYNPNQAEK